MLARIQEQFMSTSIQAILRRIALPWAAAIAAATDGAATPAVHNTLPDSWRVTVQS